MIGIGQFKCECGRSYAGKSRGDVTSKCYGCQTHNLPFTITKGIKSNKDERAINSHYCNVCKDYKPADRKRCPIVLKVYQIHFQNRNRSFSGKKRSKPK